LAVDALDNIYVISWANCNIQKFSSEGFLLSQWGSCGSEEGKFKNPFRISISPAGEIYVSDTDNNRIQVFGSAAIDGDGDGEPDTNDNCPENFNPGQEDNDQDGTGDECDRCPLDPGNDGDGDGICGDVDNCSQDSNTDQADGDADGIGDVCDTCDNRPISGTIYPSKAILWPPDHRMVPVTVEVSNLMGHNPTVEFRIPDDIPEIKPVTIIERSKEGDNIYSENNFEPDFEKADALRLNLRSERAGISQGRTYIITVTAVDCSGSYNFTTEVIVPHDKGKY
jgi:hypothetical protein